ncbi:hypothetical protein E3O46_17990 [Cryobacterium glucosi]|uniref:Uncharacterized protein n=1 Tax=Cryobacterium glucosi TaxID=1259175 RepID=A0ABY2IKN6_9MICO|nr:hypothetical protein E3O46_17990 [Cryobacterium glucosi]
MDRDGLYLFGRRWSAESLTLTTAEFAALLTGKTLAVDISGEYILYLGVDLADGPAGPTEDGSLNAGPR